LLSCKDFLEELSDFLDESLAPEIRRELERHVAECPNCWVICDTTRKTIQVYRGMEPVPIPVEIETRLMAAVVRKMAAKGSG